MTALPGVSDSYRPRISRLQYKAPGGLFFVTSERAAPLYDRRYTVRFISDDGATVTVIGVRRAYVTRNDAHRAARAHALDAAAVPPQE